MAYYPERFQKVLEYINSHLNENPDVETLSAVADLSKYHFQRQFSVLYRIGVAACQKRLRLKQASYQLAFRQHLKVIDIALRTDMKVRKHFPGHSATPSARAPARLEKIRPGFLGMKRKNPLLS